MSLYLMLALGASMSYIIGIKTTRKISKFFRYISYSFPAVLSVLNPSPQIILFTFLVSFAELFMDYKIELGIIFFTIAYSFYGIFAIIISSVFWWQLALTAFIFVMILEFAVWTIWKQEKIIKILIMLYIIFAIYPIIFTILNCEPLIKLSSSLLFLGDLFLAISFYNKNIKQITDKIHPDIIMIVSQILFYCGCGMATSILS